MKSGTKDKNVSKRQLSDLISFEKLAEVVLLLIVERIEKEQERTK